MQMKFSTTVFSVLLLSAVFLPTQASAFCGVIQETATARTAERAVSRADQAVRRQVRTLKRQHRSKLQLSEVGKTCVGGAVAIDSNGNQIVGRPSCTVTQPFCVNP